MPSAYIDQSGLEDRYTVERVAEVFSQADDGSEGFSVDSDALAATIQDASAEVEELLGVEYVVPFVAPYDPAVVEITAAFVMYRGCATRRPEYNESDGKDGTKNPYASDYKKALARCTEIKLDKRRLTNAALRPANVGGLIVNYNPDSANPFYFANQNPNNPGGSQSGY